MSEQPSADFSAIPTGTEVQATDFHSSDWELGVANTARILIGPGGSPSIGTFTNGFYDLYARPHADPELPVIRCGTIEIF